MIHSLFYKMTVGKNRYQANIDIEKSGCGTNASKTIRQIR
jgi:hypothetical protein